MTDIVIASAARTPSGCGFAKQSKRDAGKAPSRAARRILRRPSDACPAVRSRAAQGRRADRRQGLLNSAMMKTPS